MLAWDVWFLLWLEVCVCLWDFSYRCLWYLGLFWIGCPFNSMDIVGKTVHEVHIYPILWQIDMFRKCLSELSHFVWKSLAVNQSNSVTAWKNCKEQIVISSTITNNERIIWAKIEQSIEVEFYIRFLCQLFYEISLDWLASNVCEKSCGVRTGALLALVSSYQLLLNGRCTTTDDRIKDNHWPMPFRAR